MQKMNIKRDYGKKALYAYGEDLIKGLMSRSLKKTLNAKMRFMCSGYISNSVWIVTKVYAENKVKQTAYLPEELPPDARNVIAKGEYRRNGAAAIVIGPGGYVQDVSPD